MPARLGTIGSEMVESLNNVGLSVLRVAEVKKMVRGVEGEFEEGSSHQQTANSDVTMQLVQTDASVLSETTLSAQFSGILGLGCPSPVAKSLRMSVTDSCPGACIKHRSLPNCQHRRG